MGGENKITNSPTNSQGNLVFHKMVAIVDPLGAAKRYREVFQSLGYGCVKVLSSPVIDAYKKTDFAYTCTLQYDAREESSYDTIVLMLKRLGVECVVAGAEPGVPLADRLSEGLGLKSNGTELSLARRNKYIMGKVIQDSGLPTPSYAKVSEWEQIMAWKDVERVSYPIVIKPLDSAGTDGVSICENEEALRNAFKDLKGTQNILGSTNDSMLVQSFLDGEEFVVNSVSLNGKPYIVSILLGHKIRIPGAGRMYNYEEGMPRKGTGYKEENYKQNSTYLNSPQKLLAKMHKAVVKALKINWGPAHAEYMLTKDKGVVLIEVAARISGGVHIEANRKSFGCDQLTMTVFSYVDEEAFKEAAKEPYQLKRKFNMAFILLEKGGKLVEDFEPVLEKVRNLPACYDVFIKKDPGQIVKRTVDFPSSPGYIFLVHKDEEEMKKGREAITEIGQNLLEPEREVLEAAGTDEINGIPFVPFPVIADKPRTVPRASSSPDFFFPREIIMA